MFLPESIRQNNRTIITLALIGLLLYANSLNNQMFWDDDDIILNNRYVHNFQLTKFFTENQIAGANLVSNYWRPLMLTAFSLEWQVWKDWPPGYHFVNTAFHVANAILLFFILTKLLDKVASASPPRSSRDEAGGLANAKLEPHLREGQSNDWPTKQSTLLPFLVSLVFLIHPLQTEAVTYVSGLADLLSTFFIFLGILLYIQFRESYIFRDRYKYRKYYFFTIIAFILAVLSKDTAVIMPAMLVLVDFFYQKELSIRKRLWQVIKSIWPFFVLAASYLLLRATALNFSNTFNLYGEDNAFTSSFGIRLLTFFRVMLTYFELLFWPNNLHMERSVQIPSSLFEVDVVAGGTLTISLLILAFAAIKKQPIISFGIFWLFIRLFPNSNLAFPNAGLIYEHWMYVPMIGIFLIVIWAILTIAERLNQTIKHLRFGEYDYIKIAIALFILYLIPLSAKTINRNNDWQSPVTLYEQTLSYAPQSYRIINNLGMAYADDGRNEDAIKMYEKAINLNPQNAVAYHNLGNSYKELGKKDLAVQMFEKAIEKDPNFIFSYNALINLYLNDKNYDSAVQVLEKLKQINPQDQGIDQLIEQIKNLRDYDSR